MRWYIKRNVDTQIGDIDYSKKVLQYRQQYNSTAYAGTQTSVQYVQKVWSDWQDVQECIEEIQN